MKTQILVLYHSVSGHTQTMARAICHGVDSVDGAESVLRTVPSVSANTAKTEPSVPASGAPYVSLSDLTHCDGLLFGSPTHFGNMSASMKHFWDQTTQAWFSGQLQGKPAGAFSSAGSLHGGQESTLLSMMLPLMHHGMLIVGLPYSETALHTTTSGGTPYGASHWSGNQGEQTGLSEEERTLCKAHGKRVAQIAQALKQGHSS